MGSPKLSVASNMSKLILAGAGVMSIIVLAAVISTWAIIYSNPVTDTTTTTVSTTTTSCGLEDGEVCSMADECCSLHCAENANGAFTCRGCLTSGEACSAPADCCSNDCDAGVCSLLTTTSTTTSTSTTSCGLEEGELCSMPTECCSRHCQANSNGQITCGGCLAAGESCSAGGDCCSQVCDTGTLHCAASAT